MSTVERLHAIPRTALAGVVAAAAIVIAALGLLSLRDQYTIRAQFQNAGLLVEGGSVQVAGRKVGKISEIGLTPDGQADISLTIDESRLAPLHEGTRASIRALGQAGVANRFVELSPGSDSAPELPDGAVLSREQTADIVNLDALLTSFGPDERKNVSDLFVNSADIYAGSGARYFNDLLGELDPALTELDGLFGDLARDRAALARVIDRGDAAASAIASRDSDLVSAVSNTAGSLQAIADERDALSGLLERAPGVLDQAGGTLGKADSALVALRPALRDVPPAVPPLRDFLGSTRSALAAARPVVADVRDRLPDLERSLAGLPGLERAAVPGLRSAADGLRDPRHIVRGARIYGTDLLLGVLAGLAGVATANHDRWGHYARLEFTQPPQTTLGGPLSGLLSQNPLVPGLFDLRTRLTRRCPGGNAPPAIDLSSPWVPDRSLCDPSQSVPAFVNEP